jgi:hypothetical protein
MDLQRITDPRRHPASLVSTLDRYIGSLSYVLAVLAAVVVVDAAMGPEYIVPMTDLGRDIVGAEAARAGLTPYQTIGDITRAVPGLSVSAHSLDHWVAHPPFAVAGARLWSSAFGSSSEPVMGALLWLAWGFVVLWLARHVGRQTSFHHGLAMASVAAMCAGLAPDIWYLHGGALAAALLVAVLRLERSRVRWVSLLLLGLVVAWKPWLAPLALFLPNRDEAWRDAAVVGGTAVLATFVGLSFIGGLPVLGDWLRVALPANFGDVREWPLNLSIAGSFVPAAMASVFFAALALGGLVGSRKVPRSAWLLLGVLVIVVASPLVWPQYLLALIPVIVVGFGQTSYPWLLLALLLMSSALMGVDAQLAQVAVVAVAMVLAFHVAEVSGDVSQHDLAAL